MPTKVLTPETALAPIDEERLRLTEQPHNEEEYLALADTFHRIEFSHGHIEVLPMPSDKHQSIIAQLFLILHAFVRRHGGVVRFASLPLQLWEGKYREPDLMLLTKAHEAWRGERFWRGADLVVEVVSEGNPHHDYVTKRYEYARAGIPEYWIVDPSDETITVLELTGGDYAERGVFRRGESLVSATIPDLVVSIDEAFEDSC